MLPFSLFAQTIEECWQAVERNYPLIRQYDLIGKTTQLTVANIQKGWLPQVSASAQATLQSDVTSWPSEMQGLFKQMGVSLEGLKKDQYKVGVDIQQTLFDGGAITSQKEIARRQGDLETAQTEVTLYGVRQRVNDLFFSLLLLGDQVQLNQNLQEVLLANEEKLASMYKHGTAAESDYLAVKAERLTAEQNGISLKAQQATLAQMLSIFCGIEVTNPLRPPYVETASHTSIATRPEFRAIEAQLQLADAREKALDASLMPKLSVFASGFYGYPGYNMFEDMMHHRWSLNGMVGLRMQWNIGALYTHKNDRQKIAMQRDSYQVQRDVFLFNTHLQELQQTQEMARYQQLMAGDNEIIALRTKVRIATESKLNHGIIATSDLIKEINNENNARVQKSTHEIEMLKQAYDLRITTNQ
ncbi:MAG: TolC family protein [Prevotella sp.]|nr:TolC family protein [Prevotella sp.]